VDHYENALTVSQRASRIVDEFYSLHAAITVATDPRAATLAPPILPGQVVPTHTVRGLDQSEHTYHFLHYLAMADHREEFIADFQRTWMAGALLGLGDELEGHDYFDHAPELELVYHIRNGIAHGNRFRLTRPGLTRLAEHPAHNNDAWVHQLDLKITPDLDGTTVLFAFIGPGDVLDLLQAISIYLYRMSNGDPLRPEPPP